MFRLTQFMRDLANPEAARPMGKPLGPVVIWNLIRRCNLTCKHCYSISTNIDFPGELSTEQIFHVMDDLKAFRVPVLILSGGEPLLREDIYDISQRAKAMGFYVGLSTNGVLINEENVDRIAAVGYDYVGISIDGIKQTHDMFRRMQGAFDKSIHGARLCRDHGIKVGLRFTLTKDNAHELPLLLELMGKENLQKFYLSHLNYAGRGNRNRKDDVLHNTSRKAMDLLFTTCWDAVLNNKPNEFVTGNNDTDGVYLLFWVRKNLPHLEQFVTERLQQWGGNASGLNVANIDNLGNVHPDTFWWDYHLGNVKERNFSEIWQDTSDPLMAGFKQQPRPVEGRCAQCNYLAVCGGNTRVRAYQLTGNPWAEDPACYLDDDELGIETPAERLIVKPYSKYDRLTPGK